METKSLRELLDGPGPGERVERLTPRFNPTPEQVVHAAVEVPRDQSGWRSELRRRGLSRKQIEAIGRRRRNAQAQKTQERNAQLRREIIQRIYASQA
jgi:hypothetical protein